MGSVCGACSSAGSRPLCVIRDHVYVRCTACGSGRLASPPPDPAALYTDGYFDSGENGGYRFYESDAALHRWTAGRRLDRITPWLPAGRVRLLDVGCASGYVLAAATARGWEAVGAEVSDLARARAADRGLRTEPTIAAAVADLSGPVTVATFFQVLEHLVDPAVALAEAVSAAVPGAVVAVETWDLGSWTARMFRSRWQQINPPTVLHLFTRSGLTALAQRAGLRVERMKVTPKPVSLGLVAGVAAESWPRLGRRLGWAVDRTHLGQAPVLYPLDDLITVTAVKPDAGGPPDHA